MKKIIFGALLFILVAFVLYTYNAFNGNPVSKLVATKVLQNYLTVNYPEKELQIKDGFYNFKFSEYDFDVVEIGNTAQNENESPKYEMSVRGFINPEVILDGIRLAHLDEPLMDRLSQQAEEEIQALLANKVINIRDVEVYLEVVKGQLDDNVSWSKDLKLDEPIDMFIVLDSTKDTKENVYHVSQKIQEVLNDEGYAYQMVTINGKVFDSEDDGYVKFSLSFQKDTVIQLRDVDEEKQ